MRCECCGWGEVDIRSGEEVCAACEAAMENAQTEGQEGDE